jgi:hypothetical protein
MDAVAYASALAKYASLPTAVLSQQHKKFAQTFIAFGIMWTQCSIAAMHFALGRIRIKSLLAIKIGFRCVLDRSSGHRIVFVMTVTQEWDGA